MNENLQEKSNYRNLISKPEDFIIKHQVKVDSRNVQTHQSSARASSA